MIKALLTLLLATTLQGATLTNTDVIKLVEAKLSNELIVTTIRSSPTAFDTSVAALIHLRRAGVPNEVLLVMLTSDRTVTVASSVDRDVVRLEFPDAMYRVSRMRFYKGIIRVYDDRITFTPNREAFQEFARSIPWDQVIGMCYEKGPFYGDFYLTLRDAPAGERTCLGTDPPEIIRMKDAISTFTKRPIPECK